MRGLTRQGRPMAEANPATRKAVRSLLPQNTLKDQVAIVTGGSSGLGKAMAQEFLRLGAHVCILARNEDRLAAAATELAQATEQSQAAGPGSSPGQVMTFAADVRDPERVEAAVAAVVERFGRLDILVNNAAGNFAVPAENLSVNGWNAVVDIVLNGTFYCTRAAAQPMIAGGRGGNIVNILAAYAWTGGPGTVHSAAAKGGVLAMTRTLAVEWARYGIRVNAISPGPIEDTGGADVLWSHPELERQVRQSIPAGRLGRPEEVAWAAAYLASPYASFVTGDVLTIDGGQWLGKPVFQLPQPGQAPR